MVNRLLADHIEVAGSGEARGAAGSEIITDHELFVSHRAEGEAAEDAAIRSVVQRRVGGAAGVSAVEVGHSRDQVWVGIRAAQPGVVAGHRGTEADRIRAELEELTGKPVLLNMVEEPGPQKGPEAAESGSAGQGPKSWPARRRRRVLTAAAGPACRCPCQAPPADVKGAPPVVRGA